MAIDGGADARHRRDHEAAGAVRVRAAPRDLDRDMAEVLAIAAGLHVRHAIDDRGDRLVRVAADDRAPAHSAAAL
jgi:hypothetical protein